jgi:tetratricopeptide (TPR) repeat protein
VANTLLQDLGPDRARFDIKALRPPTFEQLQKELADAKQAGRPYHIVHFDGHGVYADLSRSGLADWAKALSSVVLGAPKTAKHGYLIFEHPSEEKLRPVDGQTLGQLLHDNGVPVLVLNACQSAMHQATAAPKTVQGAHDEVRAIGSLAQAVIDQGIPAVLGMRYSVYVVTAAQYIGQLYAALARGGTFGQAATQGRKHLQLNPERWVGLQPRPLQDWFVPVAYEAAPVELLPVGHAASLSDQPELDPVQNSRALLRYVPDKGFVGRDETLLALDRAFDSHRVVLLHAYAGQGKSSTAVEFARWYSLTGGLGEQPVVLLASFESHIDVDDLLSQLGQPFAPMLEQRGILWNAVNDLEKRRQIVFQILRHVPVLWIWDNVEPVAGFPEGTESQWTTDEQHDLRDFLKQINLDNASQVKILLTSRRDEEKWLGSIPHRIPMRRMSDSDAANLAFKLGEERQLNRSEIAEWQPLLDYCAGNPLTLRVLVGQAVKAGLRGRQRIADFVEAIRVGEQKIGDADADERQGRHKSLGASLDYGFRHAFQDDELPIVALLHLFQGSVYVDVLKFMGVGEHALPELKGKTKEQLTGLLERATDIGLLTQIGPDYFTIHPALPWFLRQLFVRHYDGQAGRSSAERAVHAWVEVVGELGAHFKRHFNRGNRGLIDFLELEEANLLHARRLARRNQWWSSVVSSMQGLYELYGYQGSKAEWARLVEEIIPEYCSADSEPIAGREDDYSIVMGYRVELAQYHERDLTKATLHQEKLVAWEHHQAAAALTLPADTRLDDTQRSRLKRLAVSLAGLGRILEDADSADCEQHYQQTIRILRRIDDKESEAVAQFGLGNAYKNIPEIRNLDAAEAAYQRCLELRDANDELGRSRCEHQIGMVHHQRFSDSAEREEPAEMLRHVQAAEAHLLEALRLCPRDAFPEVAPIHGQLGTLYKDVGQFGKAREHFEQAAQCFDKAGNRFLSGTTRGHMAFMYLQAAESEDRPSQQRANFQRARAYAEAALRDFQHYQGRADDDEAQARDLLDHIDQALANLPQ